MQSIESLSKNVQLLLQRYEALQAECAQLRAENARRHDELVHAHAELVALQQKNKRLATANALTSVETTEEATKRINALIAQVDRAIQALKK